MLAKPVDNWLLPISTKKSSSPYRGVVISVEDPLKISRVRVRIAELHGDPEYDDEVIPDKHLPWVLATSQMRQVRLPEVGSYVEVTFPTSNPYCSYYNLTSVSSDTYVPQQVSSNYPNVDAKWSPPSSDGSRTIVYTDVANREDKTEFLCGASITVSDTKFNMTAQSLMELSSQVYTKIDSDVTITGVLTSDKGSNGIIVGLGSTATVSGGIIMGIT